MSNVDDIRIELSKQCLLTQRDENAFICLVAVEAAFEALTLSSKTLNNKLNQNKSFQFYNYFLLNQNSIESFDYDLNGKTSKYFNTEFHQHVLTDVEERKMMLNELFNHFSDQTFQFSQKFLSHITTESVALITCSSLIFRPLKSTDWEELWSLKFHSNLHLASETKFYFTKGLFRIAFHETFQKVEIPGEVYHGIPTKLIILLPRCSSDLVHIYANLNEYIHLPFSLAFISVCIPNIFMNIEMNISESLKNFRDLFNFTTIIKQNEDTHLSAAYSLGRFVLDMTTDGSKQPSTLCVHSIDLSPVIPWVFFANRPFVFIVTYGEHYLYIGQMLGPKIPSSTKIF
ncbi:unnamed protein product [Adineta ricciae]|uniref:Serpin domain-containing protein n=1 Tax=Adineta ricciae TaxID=249248 RepID=A0A813N418_ADIRI|nr:unnamed protein product [Adineta ricciae]CAF0944793.1 unnamed protein product [Adineta ricciae]